MEIEPSFFTLLKLQRELKYRDYDGLLLTHLDVLRDEVDRKVEEMIARDKERRTNNEHR